MDVQSSNSVVHASAYIAIADSADPLIDIIPRLAPLAGLVIATDLAVIRAFQASIVIKEMTAET